MLRVGLLLRRHLSLRDNDGRLCSAMDFAGDTATASCSRVVVGAICILPSAMGVGTAINVVAVLIGGGVGTLVGARLPEGMRTTAMQAIGLVTVLIGVQNFLVSGIAPTRVVPTLTSVAVRRGRAKRKGGEYSPYRV